MNCVKLRQMRLKLRQLRLITSNTSRIASNASQLSQLRHKLRHKLRQSRRKLRPSRFHLMHIWNSDLMHIQRDPWRHTITQHWPLTSCIFSAISDVTHWPNIDPWPHAYSAGPLRSVTSHPSSDVTTEVPLNMHEVRGQCWVIVWRTSEVALNMHEVRVSNVHEVETRWTQFVTQSTQLRPFTQFETHLT